MMNKAIETIRNRKSICYTPNEDPYTLCRGKGESKCRDCCLYEDYEEYNSPYKEYEIIIKLEVPE